ncbi:MAG: CHAT domain-containing protein [Cyanobacteriota bacterium]
MACFLRLLIWRRAPLRRILRLGVLATLLGVPVAAWGDAYVVGDTTTNTTVAPLTSSGGYVNVVTGGTPSGPNLFHRFTTFDTAAGRNAGLKGVFFDLQNLSLQNLIVGVSNGLGATLAVPIVLSQSSNLIFMSPFGITVSGGASFGSAFEWGEQITPLPRLGLTTANALTFNGGTGANLFEVIPSSQSTTSGFPNGSPLVPEGLSSGSASASIVLDGLSSGPVTLEVDQALMVASLSPNSSDFEAALTPVDVKGLVTLKTAAAAQIMGKFGVGGRDSVANQWGAATLVVDSMAGALNWKAPVEVNPSSAFVLQGSVDLALAARVRLQGSAVGGTMMFASLVGRSGDHVVQGGVDLTGPGRIAVEQGSLKLQGSGSTAVFAIYPGTINNGGNNGVNFYNAYNLLFDIYPGASATVNGAIVLGQGGVTKVGDGDLTFNSPENSYTGPTKVQGGHLQVNGSVPASATCANGGTSNICGTSDKPELPPQDLVLIEDDAVVVAQASAPDTATDDQVSSFDAGTGEGAIVAPDLDVEVAINDSFVVPEADSGGEGSVIAAGAEAGGPAAFIALGSEQASAGLSRADGRSTRETLQALAPELNSAGLPPTPTPQQLQAEMQRQVQQIHSGGGGSPQALLSGPRTDEVAWIASTDLRAAGPLPPSFQRASYQPAVVHISFSEDRPGPVAGKPRDNDAFLDITLVPLDGPVEGRRVELSKKVFSERLRQLYTSLSRQDSLEVARAQAPARQLFNTLIGPIAPLLEARGVTTLLIAADRGLQAVPFAALHDGSRYFGDRYAFSITPSLALTNLRASGGEVRGQTLLAAGASRFDGLAPLPLVPQELDNVGGKASKDLFLNREFTPEVLLEKAGDSRYGRVHVATHAEFLPGGPAASYLYSGTGPIPLSTFTRLRQQRKNAPLDLISFSACRTALGDPSSELGFAGLAVQAGARSAAGTLWYVDDVATSAYFQQMYRYLGQGVPKADALQLTRQAFLRGLVRLDGDRVLAPDGVVLLQNLTGVQQRRVRDGLQNPYFWGGIELVGAPW